MKYHIHRHANKRFWLMIIRHLLPKSTIIQCQFRCSSIPFQCYSERPLICYHRMHRNTRMNKRFIIISYSIVSIYLLHCLLALFVPFPIVFWCEQIAVYIWQYVRMNQSIIWWEISTIHQQNNRWPTERHEWQHCYV